MLVSTPDMPVMTTLSSTRSARKPPKPDACQNTSLEAKYSQQHKSIVRL